MWKNSDRRSEKVFGAETFPIAFFRQVVADDCPPGVVAFDFEVFSAWWSEGF
jgi:hypothetical protein